MKKILLIPFLLLSLWSFGQTSLPTSQLWTVTGTNTYSYSPTNTIPATIPNGYTARLKFTNANTSTATLDLNGSAIALTKSDGTALSSGDIPAGSVWWVIYDSGATKWKLSGGSGGSALSFTSPLSETSGVVSLNDVPLSNIVQGTSTSILGVSGGSTADYANIQSTSDDQILRRTSGSLGFGNIFPTSITVPGQTILGNSSSSAGEATDLIIGTGLGFSGGSLVTTGAPPTGSAGGDLSGTYPNPIVSNLSSATGLPISTGLTGGSSNRIPYFTSSTAMSVSGAPVFDGTNLGIGVTPQSLLTISRQSSIQAPVSGSTEHIIGLDANPLRITFDTHNNASASGTAFMVRRSRGTSASPSALSSGDVIAAFSGRGYGTSQYAAASTGLINIKANQTFTDANNGTYISFDATPDNSVTAAEVFRFGGSGQLGIGGANFGISGNTILSGGSGAAVSWGQYAQSNLSGLGTGVSTWLGTPSYTNFKSASTGTSPFWDLGTASQTFTGPLAFTLTSANNLTFNLPSLTTTPAGIILQNTTASTLSNVKVSPSIDWYGTAFATTPSASQNIGFRAYVLPQQSTTPVDGTWVLQTSINGAAFVDRFSVSAGNGTVRLSAGASLVKTGGSFLFGTEDVNSLRLQQNNSVRFDVKNFGYIDHLTSASTASTASTEVSSWNHTLSTRQWSTGAITLNREYKIGAPGVWSAVGASTMTRGVTWSLGGAPKASTNMAITTSIGAEIETRDVSGGSGVTTSFGLVVNAQSGATTNNSAAFVGGSVGIGSETINQSAVLDLISTTKALGLPSMTKTQRDAIASPRAGLAIYQTDNTPGLRVYNGTNWMKFTETTD